MMQLLISWLIASFAIWATAALLPGFSVRNFKGALVVAAVLGVLQLVVGKVVYVIVGVATFGLAFNFLTRALITAVLLVVVDKLADSLKIKGFGTAFIGALVMAFISMVAERLVRLVF